MSQLPGLIIFINGDIVYPPHKVFIGSNIIVNQLVALQKQLFIDDIISKREFDERIRVQPDYPDIIRLRNLRLLVILPTFQDHFNEEYADSRVFLKAGLANIENRRFDEQNYFNRFDGCNKSLDMQRLTIYDLIEKDCCRGESWPLEEGVGEFCGDDLGRCGICNNIFWCDRCHTFSGIRECCGCECKCMCTQIHLPNKDRELNNIPFINRK